MSSLKKLNKKSGFGNNAFKYNRNIKFLDEQIKKLGGGRMNKKE